MPVNANAAIEITGFKWVPDFARGQVRDLRPRWALKETGLDYAERLLDATANRPADYYEEQPWGQVPVMHEGDLTIFESGAILLHIAEKHDRLLPADMQSRNRAISWLFAALNSIEPLMMQLATIDIFAKDEPWAKLRRPGLMDFIGQRLDRLSARLGDKDYLDGEFTVGDIGMATVLRIAENTNIVTSRKNLAAYVRRCEARPAFQRALATQKETYAAHEPQTVV